MFRGFNQVDGEINVLSFPPAGNFQAVRSLGHGRVLSDQQLGMVVGRQSSSVPWDRKKNGEAVSTNGYLLVWVSGLGF